LPETTVTQQACPIWVPLIENGLHNTKGGKWFIQNDIEKLLAEDPKIDTILLACTHYPLVIDLVKQIVGSNINVIAQGEIVANSLVDYLNRHPEMAQTCSMNQQLDFLTTENPQNFDEKANLFFNQTIQSIHVKID